MHFDQLRRREFIMLLGGAAAIWPLAAGAQQPAMPVIGFLHSASAGSNALNVAAFQRGLSETGFIDGRTHASSTAGPRISMIAYRNWRLSWFADRWS
jgi:hypothetical protein